MDRKMIARELLAVAGDLTAAQDYVATAQKLIDEINSSRVLTLLDELEFGVVQSHGYSREMKNVESLTDMHRRMVKVLKFLKRQGK